MLSWVWLSRNQGCIVVCNKGLLLMRQDSILCVDRRGNLLANKVQRH
jgi:hypothetical protein